jgi:uncharacterized membrane protein YeaQ/YmgE (transglycosylase-associated protein family)
MTHGIHFISYYRWYYWLVTGLILGKDVPGIIGNIIAGIIGAWIGGMLFSFGPAVAGIQIIPALIGAIILIFIVSMIMKALRKA